MRLDACMYVCMYEASVRLYAALGSPDDDLQV